MYSSSYSSVTESFEIPRHRPHTISTDLLDSSFSPDPYNQLLNTNSKLQKNKSRRSSAVDLLKQDSLNQAVQVHENDIAQTVLVYEPEGISFAMGALHPRAALYESPVNMDLSAHAHNQFRVALKQKGVRVLTVKEVLAYATNTHVGARVDLEDLAFDLLKYKLDDQYKNEFPVNKDLQFYLSDTYKRQVIEKMSSVQLVDTVCSNPVVHVYPSKRDTGIRANYQINPLSNLVFTRDQQITTAKGIVMGRLRSQQRYKESEVMRFCIQKLGLDLIGEIQEPGFLEGGDFFPAGPDLCLVGIGLRTNFEACQQLMETDMVGTRRVAIIEDRFEKDQDRMHLDCVFSILGEDVCLMYEDMIGRASPKRRLVQEWVRGANGKYMKAREEVEFSEYIEQEGYKIIPISEKEQLEYGCNVLNLGQSRVFSVHPGSSRKIIRSPYFNGDVQLIEYSSITSMYGGLHCSSQVVRRTPYTFLEGAKAETAQNDSL